MDAPTKQIRVVIQQPVLPSYRIGVFRELASRPGLSVTVVHGDDPDLPNVDSDGFRARHIPVSRIRLLGRSVDWAQSQLDYADADRTDVLVLSWNMNVASLVPALIKARSNSVATILWGHGYGKNDRWWRSIPRREVTRLADAVLLYNRTIASKLVAEGLPKDKVFVAQNTLDLHPIELSRNRWSAFPKRLEAFAKEMDIDGRPTLLFVSRLTVKSRLELLIQAAAVLREQVPDVRFVIIGDGDVAPFRAQAARLGVAENLIFVPGIYDHERLAPWFLLSRAFCYPGQVGLAAIHALAFGLPVVTGDDLPNQNPCIEALEPEINGLLFRDGDPRHMAAQLLRLISDEKLRDRMSAAGRATVQQRFTLARMIDGYEAAIRYAASRRSGSTAFVSTALAS